MQFKNLKSLKSILCGFLIFAMAFSLAALGVNPAADAKTSESARADNIFFYLTNQEGKDILLDVMSLNELEAISHGQLSEVTSGTDTGENYYFSCTDNLPTTVYTEAQGITLPELLDHVKDKSSVSGAVYISYTGSDKLYFMATDSNGSYNKSWTYDQLYSDNRYYFPGLFTSWNNAWEIDDGTYGPMDSNPIRLDIYNSDYKDGDSCYAAKRAVFANGQLTVPILATNLETDRTQYLGTEIADNAGHVTGCLKNALTADRALQLCIPQTEAVLMSGNRTAYHNFAWVYKLKLDMAEKPEISSLGTVAAPTAEVTKDGDTLSITMNCTTEGAKIYYSLTDSSPQILYTGAAVSYDVSGRDLSTSPITFHMTAVKEAYDDAGIIPVTYPQRGPVFTDIYTALVGDDVTFAAGSAVSMEDWNTWKDRIVGVNIKYPGASAYTPLDDGEYRLGDSAKTITFDKSLFSAYGSHSFLIAADSYANKTMSVTMKKAAPTVNTKDYYMNSDIVLSFADTGYQAGISASIKATETASPNPVSSSYLTQTVPGKLTIKKSYFDSANCVINAPGSYILILNNSNYAPSSQTLSIIVKDGAEKPPGTTFAYMLTPSSSSAQPGDTISVSVKLNSNENSYKFYAGEYRIVLDNSYLTLDGVTCQGNWESGGKAADGKTTLTFAALDKTDQGIDSGRSAEIGSFSVKVLKEGSSTILCTRALLTDASAAALSDVSGSDLQIRTGEGMEQSRPPGIYSIIPLDAPAYTIGSTGDGIAVMTVNANNQGSKSFSVGITPQQAHSGNESAVFVQLRDGSQIDMKVFSADYDLLNTAAADFDVQPGDVIKAYIVDELSYATGFNPFVLQ